MSWTGRDIYLATHHSNEKVVVWKRTIETSASGRTTRFVKGSRWECVWAAKGELPTAPNIFEIRHKLALRRQLYAGDLGRTSGSVLEALTMFEERSRNALDSARAKLDLANKIHRRAESALHRHDVGADL